MYHLQGLLFVLKMTAALLSLCVISCRFGTHSETSPSVFFVELVDRGGSTAIVLAPPHLRLKYVWRWNLGGAEAGLISLVVETERLAVSQGPNTFILFT